MGRSAVLAGVLVRRRRVGLEGDVALMTIVMTMVIREFDMETYKASEFKAKCLKIIDQIAETGEHVVVTKRGVPLVKVAPIVERPKSMFGVDKGKIKVLGDIISPIDVEWDAIK